MSVDAYRQKGESGVRSEIFFFLAAYKSVLANAHPVLHQFTTVVAEHMR